VSHLLLQWHVTERCNLRCRHCYQEDFKSDELDFVGLLRILAQFKELLEARQRDLGGPVRGHITLTGGEPFVRSDFLDLLIRVAAGWRWTSFAILSNGGLIDGELARRLARLHPSFVQVSLDGMEKTHDQIRGHGDFQRSIRAIEHLVGAGIRTVISFTAHRDNWQEFAAVARLACELKVSRLWSDRMLPVGQGPALGVLTAKETRAYVSLMRQARQEAGRNGFGRTEISMYRALQFSKSGHRIYHCTAGGTLLTVMPNGDLYPCRRMPIRVGNVMETSLTELYYTDPILRSLRDPDRVSQGCEKCDFQHECRGGLRCLSYATTGSPFAVDPGCWRSEPKQC